MIVVTFLIVMIAPKLWTTTQKQKNRRKI